VRRRPYLLRRFAQQVLPPPAAPLDPADRLGIDLSAYRTPREISRLMTGLWAAISHGEITPDEGLTLVRRVHRQQRAEQRLSRLLRRLAHKRGDVPGPLG
jgi:hypothetical protein